MTAVSPRLPSGALLAITVAMTAATAVLAPLPAQAAPGAPGGIAASRAGMTSQAAADKIRDQEWWLANLHVTQAWAATRGTGVTVAVLSSGVAADHPDLTGSVITGPDFTESGETPATSSWGIEGTSAASIIAGHGDNVGDAAGIIGVAPAARILSVRVVLDATDPLNGNPAAVQRLPAAIAAGIRYAAAHGAQVIDLPLDPASLASDGAATGGLSAAAGGSAAEQAAVDYALGKGAVLIAPTSDNGEDGNEPTYPAAYPGVIAVGTVDRHFARAAFSSRQLLRGAHRTRSGPHHRQPAVRIPEHEHHRRGQCRRRRRCGPDPVPVSHPEQQPGQAGAGDRQRAPATLRHGGGLRRGHSGRAESGPGGRPHRGAARGTVGHGQLTGGGTPAHDPARSAQNGHPGPDQDGAAGRGHGYVHAHPSTAGELDRHPGPAPAGGPGASSRPGTLDPAERSPQAAGDTGRRRPAHAGGCGGARRRADGGGGNGALADRTTRPGHTATDRGGGTDRSHADVGRVGAAWAATCSLQRPTAARAAGTRRAAIFGDLSWPALVRPRGTAGYGRFCPGNGFQGRPGFRCDGPGRCTLRRHGARQASWPTSAQPPPGRPIRGESPDRRARPAGRGDAGVQDRTPGSGHSAGRTTVGTGAHAGR